MHGACILSFIVHTCDSRTYHRACFYRSPSVHAMLVHTMDTVFVVYRLYTRDARTYHRLLLVWSLLRLAPTKWFWPLWNLMNLTN